MAPQIDRPHLSDTLRQPENVLFADTSAKEKAKNTDSSEGIQK